MQDHADPRSGPAEAPPPRPVRRRALPVLLVFAAAAGLAGVVWAGPADPLPVLSPVLCAGVAVAGGLLLLWSWCRRGRRWWAVTLPALVGGTALAVGAAKVLLWRTRTVVDPYPALFLLLAGAVLLALAGLPWTLRRGGRRGAAWAALLAVPATLLGAGLCANREYGLYVTVGDALGRTAGLESIDELPASPAPPTPAAHAGRGRVVSFTAPGTRSGFTARPGAAYLPPAYFTPARADLPVLVLLPGTPGAPLHWVSSGRAVEVADAYAARHGGHAPVLIFADPNGTSTGDTECVDGPVARAETYLTADIPAYVTRRLGIRHDPRRWGLVGFSAGGTCAIHLVLRDPTRYGHFLSIGGDAAPALATPEETRSRLFGGSAEVQRAYDPAVLLATRRYEGVTGWFAAGTADPHRRTTAARLSAAARGAGVDARAFVGRGGHTWHFVRDVLQRVTPVLFTELGTGVPAARFAAPAPRVLPPLAAPPG
ncbi:alpha/beta hydrolase [Pilimelia terevasa]|nr:alpha/beta hydrolase-fold protein [Pilimelia terevasa]